MTTQSFPLKLQNGHLFIEISGQTFILDTGAPSSFGTDSSVTLHEMTFDLPSSYLGLTAANLSDLVGYPVSGIFGADILNRFDVLIDCLSGRISFATEQIEFPGNTLSTDEFMGIPVIDVTIAGVPHRMFFDTGAQISYFQDDSISRFPNMGSATDFYPGFGQFETETWRVDMQVGQDAFQLRCGTLPDLLGMTLMMADAEGIIGNEILQDRKAGLFFRRNRLVLS
jgi:hypothetical protein